MRGVEIDELRPLTAGRLLELWREIRETADTELERCLLCNAAVLAESCRFGGEPVFPDGAAVLAALTGRQMEELLRRLAGEDSPRSPAAENPAFDPERFRELEGD